MENVAKDEGMEEMDLNKSTLSQQIYQILRSDIITGRIAMGQKLTLKMLQERFGVSSTPIREALARLAEDELAIYYSNVGVNVISLTEQDLRELYSFMGDLDALAIRYASRSAQNGELCRKLEENVAFTGSMIERPDPDRGGSQPVDTQLGQLPPALLSILREQPPGTRRAEAAQSADDIFLPLRDGSGGAALNRRLPPRYLCRL